MEKPGRGQPIKNIHTNTHIIIIYETDDSESEYISRIHSHNLQLFLLKSKPGNYFPLMWPYIRGFYVGAKKKKKKVLNDYHHYRKVWDGTTT